MSVHPDSTPPLAAAAIPFHSARFSQERVLWDEPMPGGVQWSGVLRRGTTLRVTDLEGRANVAVLLFNKDQPTERYNMPDTLKYNRSLGNFMGNLNSAGSQYFDLSAAIDLTNGFTLVPHVGHQSIPGQDGMGDYTDWSLTLSKDFGNGRSATLAATATDGKKVFYTDTAGRFVGKTAVEAGVKYSF